MPSEIKEHELEKKRLEFVEWQQSEHFDVDDVDYETVEKFIASCGQTMVPALVSAAVKASVRVGCFRNDLAAMRFVATAMEEEAKKRRGVWIEFASDGRRVADILHASRDSEMPDSYVWCEAST